MALERCSVYQQSVFAGHSGASYGVAEVGGLHSCNVVIVVPIGGGACDTCGNGMPLESKASNGGGPGGGGGAAASPCMGSMTIVHECVACSLLLSKRFQIHVQAL